MAAPSFPSNNGTLPSTTIEDLILNGRATNNSPSGLGRRYKFKHSRESFAIQKQLREREIANELTRNRLLHVRVHLLQCELNAANNDQKLYQDKAAWCETHITRLDDLIHSETEALVGEVANTKKLALDVIRTIKQKSETAQHQNVKMVEEMFDNIFKGLEPGSSIASTNQ